MSLIARTLLVASFVAGCAPSERSRQDCDPDDESEFPGGFFVRGLSVATNGNGYLTANIGYGDCLERFESRIYSIDAAARITVPAAVDYWPGEALASRSGQRALIMGFRDQIGLVHPPDDVVYVEGLAMTEISLGAPAWDIAPGDGGWLAAAGIAGAWWINDTGDAVHLTTQPSYCSALASGLRLICAGGAILVLDSSGGAVSSIALPKTPSFISGAPELGVALVGTSMAVIVDAAVDRSIPLGVEATTSWLSPDSRFVIAQGGGLLHRIDLQGDLVTSVESTAISDVEFLGTRALFTYGEPGRLGSMDLPSGVVELLYAPPPRYPFNEIEHLGGTQYLIASSMPGAGWDLDEAATHVFVTFDASDGSFGEYWGVPSD